MQKKETGNFVPKVPKYTISDFEEEFQETQLTNKQIEEIYYGKDEPKINKVLERFKNSWVDGWEFVRNTAVMGSDYPDRSEDASEQTLLTKQTPPPRQDTNKLQSSYELSIINNAAYTSQGNTPQRQAISSPSSMVKKTPGFTIELSNFEMFSNRHTDLS